MRFLIAFLSAIAVICVGTWRCPAGARAGSAGTGKVDIDINTHGSGGAWWANPIWIAIGVIALVLPHRDHCHGRARQRHDRH
jgi:hypothetical protein